MHHCHRLWFLIQVLYLLPDYSMEQANSDTINSTVFEIVNAFEFFDCKCA